MGEWSDGHSAGQSRVAATFGSVNTEEERLPLHRPSRAETLTRSLSRPLFCPPTTTVRNLLFSATVESRRLCEWNMHVLCSTAEAVAG